MFTPFAFVKSTAAAAPAFSYLLNEYPGSFVAYSLRQLSSSYSGPAITVRRSSDNAEQDIGFSSGELDIASLSSFCAGTSGFVKTWHDQSVSNKDVTQSTTANQPQIYGSGSCITFNGKPAMSFDGSNDGFLFPSMTINSAYTTFELFKINTAGSDRTILTSNQSDMKPFQQYQTNTPGVREWRSGASILTLDTVKQWVIAEIMDSDKDVTLYSNNATSTTGTEYTSFFGTQQFQIGLADSDVGTNAFDGYWQELVLWNSNQVSNQSGIRSNINTFYSIA